MKREACSKIVKIDAENYGIRIDLKRATLSILTHDYDGLQGNLVSIAFWGVSLDQAEEIGETIASQAKELKSKSKTQGGEVWS